MINSLTHLQRGVLGDMLSHPEKPRHQAFLGWDVLKAPLEVLLYADYTNVLHRREKLRLVSIDALAELVDLFPDCILVHQNQHWDLDSRGESRKEVLQAGAKPVQRLWA